MKDKGPRPTTYDDNIILIMQSDNNKCILIPCEFFFLFYLFSRSANYLLSRVFKIFQSAEFNFRRRARFSFRTSPCRCFFFFVLYGSVSNWLLFDTYKILIHENRMHDQLKQNKIKIRNDIKNQFHDYRITNVCLYFIQSVYGGK